eukprot:4436211-Ditylum_brightwellii.AAC.1
MLGSSCTSHAKELKPHASIRKDVMCWRFTTCIYGWVDWRKSTCECESKNSILKQQILMSSGTDKIEKFTYRTKRGGVYFTFDGLDMAFITVRYTFYQFATDQHLTDMAKRVTLQKCPRFLMLEEEESKEEDKVSDEEDKFLIHLDCKFICDGSLYRVT